jgi:coenzyme F420-reducing hydrogenase gamma subunit
VTGNVPALRNVIPVNKLLQHIYIEGADADPCIPHDGLPQLSKQARPAQDFVKIDVCLPGCPPQTKVIAGLLNNLIEGRKPEANQKIKFG